MNRSMVSTVLLFAAMFLPILVYQGVACRSVLGAEIIVTPTCNMQ